MKKKLSKILKKLKANSKTMEFWKCFVFKIALFFSIKIYDFPEFSDKIYNSYNKAPQKCLECLDKFG